MKRIPEPEIMRGGEQAKAYAEADFSDANSLFVKLFLRFFPAFKQGTIADLGCGPADIPIRLCKALPEICVTAVDASSPMIELARKAVDEAGLERRIELVETNIITVTRCFDAVISNSLLHHLPDPVSFWTIIKEMANPGSPLLIMDLARPMSKKAAMDIVRTHSKNEPKILKEDFYRSLLASYTLSEIGDQLHCVGLNHIRVEIVSERHWAAWGKMKKRRRSRQRPADRLANGY